MSEGKSNGTVSLDSLAFYYVPTPHETVREGNGKNVILEPDFSQGYLRFFKQRCVRHLVAQGVERIVYDRKDNVTFFSEKNPFLGGISLHFRREGEFVNDSDGRTRTIIGVYVKIKKTGRNGNVNDNKMIKVKGDRWGNHVIPLGDYVHIR